MHPSNTGKGNQMPRALPSSLLIGLVALASTGCEGLLSCTEMGCGATVLVDLVGIDSVAEGAMTLQMAGENPTPVQCDRGLCMPALISWREHPDEFTLRLELPDTTISRNYEPTYRSSYPNGRSCGPECRTARVTFTVE